MASQKSHEQEMASEGNPRSLPMSECISRIIDRNHKNMIRLGKLTAFERHSQALQEMLEGKITRKDSLISTLEKENSILSDALESMYTLIIPSQAEDSEQLLIEKNRMQVNLECLQYELAKHKEGQLEANLRYKKLEYDYFDIIEMHKSEMNKSEEQTKRLHNEIHELGKSLSTEKNSKKEASLALEGLRQQQREREDYWNNKLIQTEDHYKAQVETSKHEVDATLAKALEDAGAANRKHRSAQQEITKLEYHLNLLLTEIEDKAPAIAQQKKDYESLLMAYNELSTKFHDLNNRESIESKRLQELETSLKEEEHQRDLLQREYNAVVDQLQSVVLNPSYSPDIIKENARLKVSFSDIRRTVESELRNNESVIIGQEKAIATLSEEVELLKSRLSVSLSPPETIHTTDDLLLDKDYQIKQLSLKTYSLSAENESLQSTLSLLRNSLDNSEQQYHILSLDSSTLYRKLSKLSMKLQESQVSETSLRHQLELERVQPPTQSPVEFTISPTPPLATFAPANLQELLSTSSSVFSAWQRSEAALQSIKSEFCVESLQLHIENDTLKSLLSSAASQETLDTLVSLEEQNRKYKDIVQWLQKDILSLKEHNSSLKQALKTQSVPTEQSNVTELAHPQTLLESTQELTANNETLKSLYAAESSRSESLTAQLHSLSAILLSLKAQNSALKAQEATLLTLSCSAQQVQAERRAAELKLPALSLSSLQELYLGSLQQCEELSLAVHSLQLRPPVLPILHKLVSLLHRALIK